MSFLRAYFARTPDPYAGGDLENAQRIGAVLFGLQAILIAGLVPLSPPTHAVGEAGWLVAAGIVLASVAISQAMRTSRFQSWDTLLATSYGAVASLAVMQWLAGGVDAPYERAILIPVFFVAAIHPPRRIAGFLAFVGLALMVPFAYSGWDAQAAGGFAASYVIMIGVSLGVNVPMSAIRAQRLAHARDEAMAREEARHDSLTGLRNRRAFDEELVESMKLAQRLEVPLTVVMLDVVNFKEINDRWSPVEGDRCLKVVAGALRSAMRDPDLCFRWGGDEFALILIGTGFEGAQSLGERLAGEVSSSCRRPNDEPVEIRFAVAQLQEDQTCEELVERTGLAMTAAKAKLHSGHSNFPISVQTTKATSST